MDNTRVITLDNYLVNVANTLKRKGAEVWLDATTSRLSKRVKLELMPRHPQLRWAWMVLTSRSLADHLDQLVCEQRELGKYLEKSSELRLRKECVSVRKLADELGEEFCK